MYPKIYSQWDIQLAFSVSFELDEEIFKKSLFNPLKVVKNSEIPKKFTAQFLKKSGKRSELKNMTEEKLRKCVLIFYANTFLSHYILKTIFIIFK